MDFFTKFKKLEPTKNDPVKRIKSQKIKAILCPKLEEGDSGFYEPDAAYLELENGGFV